MNTQFLKGLKKDQIINQLAKEFLQEKDLIKSIEDYQENYGGDLLTTFLEDYFIYYGDYDFWKETFDLEKLEDNELFLEIFSIVQQEVAGILEFNDNLQNCGCEDRGVDFYIHCEECGKCLGEEEGYYSCCFESCCEECFKTKYDYKHFEGCEWYENE